MEGTDVRDSCEKTNVIRDVALWQASIDMMALCCIAATLPAWESMADPVVSGALLVDRCKSADSITVEVWTLLALLTIPCNYPSLSVHLGGPLMGRICNHLILIACAPTLGMPIRSFLKAASLLRPSHCTVSIHPTRLHTSTFSSMATNSHSATPNILTVGLDPATSQTRHTPQRIQQTHRTTRRVVISHSLSSLPMSHVSATPEPCRRRRWPSGSRRASRRSKTLLRRRKCR